MKRPKTKTSRSRLAGDDDDSKKLWFDLPYNGKGEQLVKYLIKKLKRYFIEKVSIVVKYRINKSSLFCPTKNRVSWNQKANVINIIQCPG